MWLVYALSATVFFAGSNVLDSILVHSYEKRPWVLQWSQGIFSLIVLAGLALTMDLSTSWAVPLMIGGVFAYAADALFFYIINRVDISVTHAAWAIVSIFLSVIGFWFLGERWTALQTVGVVCIVAGVFLLSYWHAHVSVVRTLLLFTFLALLAVPWNIVQKLSLLEHQSFAAVFFWSLISRESIAVGGPLLLRRTRRPLLATVRTLPPVFFFLNAIVILLFFTATILIVAAFSSGFLSLVSVAGDFQPFFVLSFAWIASRLFPTHAPRELLSGRSVAVKIVSFSIVFFGLALLAIAH